MKDQLFWFKNSSIFWIKCTFKKSKVEGYYDERIVDLMMHITPISSNHAVQTEFVLSSYINHSWARCLPQYIDRYIRKELK